MDNVQNYDSYINIPSSQTCRSYMTKSILQKYKFVAIKYQNFFRILSSIVFGPLHSSRFQDCQGFEELN
jgi:hypothetical protein